MYFFYYIPLGINVKLRRVPAMTLSYAAICILVFAWVRYAPALPNLDFYGLIYVPMRGTALTAIGAAFLHFGYMHLIGNLAYLVFFGRYVEDRMGPLLFTVVFLVSGGIGNYLQGLYNTNVLHDPVIGIVGASGAISGLLGAFSVRFIWSKVRLAYWAFMPLQAFTRAGTVEIPAVFAIALWFVLQVARGLVQSGTGGAQVAYISHLGGFATGMVLALAFGQHTRGRVESLLRRGESYMQKGQPYAAQGAYIRYLTFSPEDAHVYARLARAMILSGNHAGALKNYQQACQMFLDQGQRGRGEKIFQEALRGCPGFALDADRHLSLAFGLERNLKPNLAIAAYENFARQYPTHPESAFTLLRAAGLYWNALANLEKADVCYRELIERYPDDRWVDFAREQIRCLSG